MDLLVFLSPKGPTTEVLLVGLTIFYCSPLLPKYISPISPLKLTSLNMRIESGDSIFYPRSLQWRPGALIICNFFCQGFFSEFNLRCFCAAGRCKTWFYLLFLSPKGPTTEVLLVGLTIFYCSPLLPKYISSISPLKLTSLNMRIESGDSIFYPRSLQWRPGALIICNFFCHGWNHTVSFSN